MNSTLTPMNKFEEVQQIIAQLEPNFRTEKVELKGALNRILAEDITADINMPPFNKSAMDGYACHHEDIDAELEVLEVIHAGKVSQKAVGKNQCVKIMTGAMVPEGCDCVFKVEDSEETSKYHVRCTNLKTTRNICYLGEDFKVDDKLLSKGTIINPAQMAVLASAGKAEVEVVRNPKIAVIATGSELVAPHEKPQGGQIRNSNSSQLISQLNKMGLCVNTNLLLNDDYNLIYKTFEDAQKTHDIIFFTGGASVGDFDFIPDILKAQNFAVLWERTGIKPGNPMTFSKKSNTYCFGLSGNPVSSLVQFEFIAKPALYRLMSAHYTPIRLSCLLNFDYRRKKADRLAIVPVLINNEGRIEAIPFNGSAHINALPLANAFMEIPQGIQTIKKGESTYVRPL